MGVAANKRAGGKRAERVRTRLRKGDTVLVTTGKERGKTGKIFKILAEKNRAIVERLNMVKRHRSGQGPKLLCQSWGGVRFGDWYRGRAHALRLAVALRHQPRKPLQLRRPRRRLGAARLP